MQVIDRPGPTGAPDAGPTFEGRQLPHPDESVFDQGLGFDLETLVDRRHVLKMFGYAGLGAGLFAIAACNTSNATPAASAAATTAAAIAAATSAPSSAATTASALPQSRRRPQPRPRRLLRRRQTGRLPSAPR